MTTNNRIGEGPYKYRVTFRAIGMGGKEYFNTELHRSEDDYRLRALALNWTVHKVLLVETF